MKLLRLLVRPEPQGATASETPALAFERVSLAFDENVVLRDVSFSVPRGAMRKSCWAPAAAASR
jgi:ABC-type multidrug transport system fused ATPase/permease subunit